MPSDTSFLDQSAFRVSLAGSGFAWLAEECFYGTDRSAIIRPQRALSPQATIALLKAWDVARPGWPLCIAPVDADTCPRPDCDVECKPDVNDEAYVARMIERLSHPMGWLRP